MATVTITDCIHQFNPDIEPKPKQLECIEYILAGRDVVANLPVGYGKSLIYQVLPIVMKTFKSVPHPVVLVISPLNIIQSEQSEVLSRHNIPVCRLAFCDKDGENGLEDSSIIAEVMNGNFEVVFAHPEALLNTAGGRELLGSEKFVDKVMAVVVDECHVVESWGEEFRTAFSKLKTLPAIFNKKPILALSGTLTKEQISKLPYILGLQNPAIVQESPDRKNIFLRKEVKLKGIEDDVTDVYEHIFKTECDNLKKKPRYFPCHLIVYASVLYKPGSCIFKILVWRRRHIQVMLLSTLQ